MSRTPITAIGVLLTLALAPAAAAQNCPATVRLPGDQWPEATEALRQARPEAVAELEDYAFVQPSARAKEGFVRRTESLLVIHKGTIIYEKYAHEFGPDTRHELYSVTKAVFSALTGVAVGLGAVALDDSICKHLKVSNPDQCAIRLVDVLEFASGLRWLEDYGSYSARAGNQRSSPNSMRGVGRHDRLAFVLSHPVEAQPGTRFRYSSGDAIVVGAVLRSALEKTHGPRWPWTLLFDRIGIQTAVIERDAKGNFASGSSLFTTPRDLARVGLLYLDDGCWNGTRVLPEGWVADSTGRVSPAYARTPPADSVYVGGRSWWLNLPVPEAELPAPYPDLPADLFYGLGVKGQFLMVVPSQDLVVVRTGNDTPNLAISTKEMLTRVLALVAP